MRIKTLINNCGFYNVRVTLYTARTAIMHHADDQLIDYISNMVKERRVFQTCDIIHLPDSIYVKIDIIEVEASFFMTLEHVCWGILENKEQDIR